MPQIHQPGLMIGITQPRRIAAISLAQRLEDEMHLHNKEIGYQIRHDANYSDERTKIKFMTDGILLRELQSDLLLS